MPKSVQIFRVEALRSKGETLVGVRCKPLLKFTVLVFLTDCWHQIDSRHWDHIFIVLIVSSMRRQVKVMGALRQEGQGLSLLLLSLGLTPLLRRSFLVCLGFSERFENTLTFRWLFVSNVVEAKLFGLHSTYVVCAPLFSAKLGCLAKLG